MDINWQIKKKKLLFYKIELYSVKDLLFCCVLQIIHDLDHLATEVCGNYIEHMLKIINSCSTQVVDTVKNNILQGGQSRKDLVPSVIDSIIETLVEKSNEVHFFNKLFFCNIIHR